MGVGKVRMAVAHRRVRVPVRVRLAGGLRPIVQVLMVLIVRVPVLVRQWLVRVQMPVALGQV